MRLARAEEPRDPDADLPGDVGVLRVLDRIAVGREELAEVLVEFPGDDELVQLLPDGQLVQLVGLHDAVDRPEDVLDKEILDLHVSLGYGTRRKAR